MKKILVAGIGGVGGYIGGYLACKYSNDPEIEVNFLVRETSLNIFKSNGLRVKRGNIELRVKPNRISDQGSDFGIMDYIIICVKAYDLEKVIVQLRSCIDKNTVILPLLNGVDNSNKIGRMISGDAICDGCIYIVSRLIHPGSVTVSEDRELLYFGIKGEKKKSNNNIMMLERIFREAGINGILTSNIEEKIWEKFVFLSPVASITSYYNSSIGEIMKTTEIQEILKRLISEVAQLAMIKNVSLREDIMEHTYRQISALSFGTTSSMHRDFAMKKPQTELECLTGYVVNESENHCLHAPTFKAMYKSLDFRLKRLES